MARDRAYRAHRTTAQACRTARIDLTAMTHTSPALTIPLAAVLLALAVPAGIAATRGWAGRLRREGRLGIHTPPALASDDAFTLANRVAAPLVGSAAAVGSVCAVLVLALPIGTAGALIVFVLGLAGVLGQFAAGSRLGDRAARTVPVPARKPTGGGCCGAGGCGCGADSTASGENGCGSGSCDCGDGACSAGSSSAAIIPDLVADAPLR